MASTSRSHAGWDGVGQASFRMIGGNLNRGNQMVACAECGNQISETAKFCPQCGATLGEKPETAVDLSSVRFQHKGSGSQGGARSSDSAGASGEAGFIAGFERKVLFRISRFVAFAVCLVLFLVMVGGLIFMLTTISGADKPDASAVVQELKPDTPSTSPRASEQTRTPGPSRGTLGPQSPLTGLRVGPELQELMGQTGNREVLENWASELEQADRQPFMDGLGEAIREARRHGVDDADAVNSYRQHFQTYIVEREASKLASIEARLYVAGAVTSILLLLAAFSLVLVLLAIERNTYRSANSGQPA